MTAAETTASLGQILMMYGGFIIFAIIACAIGLWLLGPEPGDDDHDH
jgi:hypothetical protein